MATMCFEDDFHNRVRKHLQAKFRESVIPSHLVPYLQCLTKVDEERVQAIETNSGPTLAADELFNLIIRRPNWTQDLARALRDPNVKLAFLADDIDNLLSRVNISNPIRNESGGGSEEVPMRWNVNGFLDNFGSACFDGNCSTNEPMQHDKGSVPVPSLPEAVALEPKQRMKVLKGIEDTACETPVQSCVRESTEQKADTQSIEERRETLRLNIIEKIWNLVKRPEDIPDALTYVDRVNLQITGIEKGSLLFKVMVNTLDDLERLQKLVIYGGMKKILDQELIEKHMGTFKDLARAESLELLNVNSKLYIYESDLERCKSVLLSAPKGNNSLAMRKPVFEVVRPEERWRLENLRELPTKNFQNENDILMLKQLKEILPPICIKLLEDPFLKLRLPRFFSLHAQAVRDSLKRQIKPLTKYEIEDMLGRIEQLLKAFKKDNFLFILKQILESQDGTEDREELHELFLEWVEGELAAFLDSSNQRDLEYLIQIAFEQILEMLVVLPIRTHDPSPQESHRILSPRQHEGGLFGKFPHLVINLKAVQSLEAYTRLESIDVITKCNERFEFSSALLRDIMFAYLLDTYDIIENVSSNKAMKCEFLHLTLSLFCREERRLQIVDNMISNALPGYSVANSFLEYAEGDVGKAVHADLWLYDKLCTTISFLRDGLMSLSCLTSVNKNVIIIKIETLNELSELLYLTSDRLLRTLLLQKGVSNEYCEIQVAVKLPGFKPVTRNNPVLRILSEFLGASGFTSRLSINMDGIIASDFMRHLETGNFANIKHLSLCDTKINETVSSPLGLRYLPQLQTIDLHNCGLGDTGIIAVGSELSLLKEVTEINIAKNKISSEGLQDLSNCLSENHGITALRLQNNNIGVEGGVVLAGWLKKLYLLETINISACGIEDVGAKYVSKSFVSKVLRQLSMRENEITKEGSVMFFENMRRKKMLEHLVYGRNKVFDDSDITLIEEPVGAHMDDRAEVELASFLQEQTHWSHLNMWACNLGAFRIFQFPEKFHAMKDLVHLCLQSNQLDNHFAVDVGACLKEHCEHIRHVNLKHNRIGTVGAIAIAEGIANKKYIEELLIDRNQIEKDGVYTLLDTTLQLTHPIKLDVSCNSLAKFDIDNLVHALSLQVSAPEKSAEGQKEAIKMYTLRDKEFHQIYM